MAMSAATKDSLSQADIILNRTNVALARSQRLIQSWLPPKPQAEHQDAPQQPAADEDEDDFRGDSEMGGIGSAAQRADDSGLPEGVFKRRNPGANDKLLDSLLGKRAANAHRKAQALAKSAAGAGAGAGVGSSQPLQAGASNSWTKEPVKKRPAQDSDSDEEEGGRAAAFKSKKAKPSLPPPRRTPEDTVESSGANADVAEVAGEETTLEAPPQETTASVKSSRKRPASYLDELLGQKANKKSKKKNKQTAAG